MKQTSTTKTRATPNPPAAAHVLVAADDAPALSMADFERATFRIAGAVANRSQWQAAVRVQVPPAGAKQRISIMLDAPVIAHFKAAAGERGYQTLINDALRRTVDGEQFIEQMRSAIRQELSAQAGT